jgi:DNA-directed RNA polymerase specialized sigma24 family protein
VAKPPFHRLLDEHAAALLHFCIASAGPQDGEDVFQETVVAALQAYPRVRRADNLRGWLFTIAHRKALDHHRARRRGPLPVPDPEPDGAACGHVPADDALWRSVDGLPPRQRATVLLRFAGDLSHREIAGVLGSSEAAARRALSDALATLRRERVPDRTRPATAETATPPRRRPQ